MCESWITPERVASIRSGDARCGTCRTLAAYPPPGHCTTPDNHDARYLIPHAQALYGGDDELAAVMFCLARYGRFLPFGDAADTWPGTIPAPVREQAQQLYEAVDEAYDPQDRKVWWDQFWAAEQPRRNSMARTILGAWAGA